MTSLQQSAAKAIDGDGPLADPLCRRTLIVTMTRNRYPRTGTWKTQPAQDVPQDR